MLSEGGEIVNSISTEGWVGFGVGFGVVGGGFGSDTVTTGVVGGGFGSDTVTAGVGGGFGFTGQPVMPA